MFEVELKFQVPEASRRAVDAAVGASGLRRTRLQALYFDTSDRRLAAAGLALRLRKEGRHWVQTLKAGGSSAMQRLEHNVPLPAGAAPAVDTQRHAGTPAGELLTSALAARDSEPAPPGLHQLYATDVWRRRRTLRAPGGTVELAFDSGQIVAGDRRWPVCELEIELVHGQPQAVIATAQRWVRRHGLWLDVRSKAERGDRLARDVHLGPAVRAGAVKLNEAMSADAALREVIGNCLQQILPNASEIAGGHCSDEHVHQLRVGLRRLRTALRFFDGWTSPVPAAWGDRIAGLFRYLGVSRDRDALTASLLPSLQAAGAPLFELPPAPEGPTPTELLRTAEASSLLLDMLGWQIAAAMTATPAPALKDAADERLERWHRRVAQAGKRYADLDDVARHTLRKRAKRLRYAAEFAASLYKGKAVARYLARLAPVQDSLGRFNDLCVALATYRSAVGDDPRAWFAIGWLTARRDVLLAESASVLKDFARSKPYWNRR